VRKLHARAAIYIGRLLVTLPRNDVTLRRAANIGHLHGADQVLLIDPATATTVAETLALVLPARHELTAWLFADAALGIRGSILPMDLLLAARVRRAAKWDARAAKRANVQSGGEL
jgi:hypothetical protein